MISETSSFSEACEFLESYGEVDVIEEELGDREAFFWPGNSSTPLYLSSYQENYVIEGGRKRGILAALPIPIYLRLYDDLPSEIVLMIGDPCSYHSFFILEERRDGKFLNEKRIPVSTSDLLYWGLPRGSNDVYGVGVHDIVEHMLYQYLLEKYGVAHAHHELGMYLPLPVGRRKATFIMGRWVEGRIPFTFHIEIFKRFEEKGKSRRLYKRLRKEFQKRMKEALKRLLILNADFLHYGIWWSFTSMLRDVGIEGSLVDLEEAHPYTYGGGVLRVPVPRFSPEVDLKPKEVKKVFEKKEEILLSLQDIISIYKILKALNRLYDDGEYEEAMELILKEPKEYWVRVWKGKRSPVIWISVKYEKPDDPSKWIKVSP